MSLTGRTDQPAGSERILVAEDDAAVSFYIRAVLDGQGYQVVQTCNGEEAVAKYREQGPFDLAILDLHMPILDGQNALEQIRAFHPSMRGLVLSGMPVEDELSLPDWAHGFDGFLCKPFEPAELVKLVRRLLDRKPQG